jgi:hypothetical protein
MNRTNLENLAKVGKLKAEPPARVEIEGLVRSGLRRLQDAENKSLNLESRFDLAYNAAHALALAALRYRGFRSENRYQVFQCLIHTLGLPDEMWRVLDQAHRKRNLAEYEGIVEIDTALVEAMIRVAHEMERRIAGLDLPEED